MGLMLRVLQTSLYYAAKLDENDEIWHGNITTIRLLFLLEKRPIKDSWDKSVQRPKDPASRNPNSVIKPLLQDSTNTTLNDAILLD
ncbi:hypothetical protein BP6252_07492 [Coleophoma cylindrospora]|uniref:Uncharacterized protein n=1 Tax=Coleophoma cylindrospora TaxID=1849047 RepID=A0A3D8RHQ4_9HELO|nr:hypothetical protein BP6252_07492 [Coleophoma cylindrospora]